MKNLPLSTSQTHLPSKWFPPLQQDHLFVPNYFAERTEIAIMCFLRQIFHEASGGVTVVVSEQFRIGPFQERQTWEKA